jgi:nitrous oxidase accessory protein
MRRAVAFAVVFVLVAARGEARTWTVGGDGADFPLIGPAIAAASPGDIIRVRGGVYREDLVIDKRLSIVGEGQPIVFGTGLGSVVTITTGDCELSGFTIESSGSGLTNEMDAAVQVRSNGNRIVNNRMRRVFYGIVVANGTHNEIADNDIQGLGDLPFGRRGDGIYLYRAPENFRGQSRSQDTAAIRRPRRHPRGRRVQTAPGSRRCHGPSS